MPRKTKKFKKLPELSDEDDVMRHIADEDGDVHTDADVCDECGCLKTAHVGGRGVCSCGGCSKYRGG